MTTSHYVMIPAGYMAKRIAQRPDWLKAPGVRDIYSVSTCVSKAFMDFIRFWRHNGYWFFDDPKAIQELARENSLDMRECTFFYYEVYEMEFDEQSKEWLSFKPSDLSTHVIPPAKKQFRGYDIVTFNAGTSPECSPLSCNHLASEMSTNTHCLLETFEEARNSLESGEFDRTEPGPFRIFSVYTIDPDNMRDASNQGEKEIGNER
jgi:hypothetical protein